LEGELAFQGEPVDIAENYGRRLLNYLGPESQRATEYGNRMNLLPPTLVPSLKINPEIYKL
jgi:hypothetical protein